MRGAPGGATTGGGARATVTGAETLTLGAKLLLSVDDTMDDTEAALV